MKNYIKIPKKLPEIKNIELKFPNKKWQQRTFSIEDLKSESVGVGRVRRQSSERIQELESIVQRSFRLRIFDEIIRIIAVLSVLREESIIFDNIV